MTDDHQYISYEDWGRQFFLGAVTPERVLQAVNVLAGRPVNLGPFGAGPGRLAKVTANGQIHPATATTVPGDLVRLSVQLPVQLRFEIDLQVEVQKFDAALMVPLQLSARAVDGLKVYIEVATPRPDDIEVDLRARGLRASITSAVANIDGELRRMTARYVARELEKEPVRSARLIDVSRAIDGAMGGIVGGPRGDPALPAAEPRSESA